MVMQEASGRAFNLYQVIAQTSHNLFYDLLQCHVFSSIPGKRKPDNPRRPLLTASELQNQSTKKTGGWYPPVWS